MQESIIYWLENGLNTWNGNLEKILGLLTMTTRDFNGGLYWTMWDIYMAFLPIGSALLVTFFFAGLIKSTGSVVELKRPEILFKNFVRLAIAEYFLSHSWGLMVKAMNLAISLIQTAFQASGMGSLSGESIPDAVTAAVQDLGFWASIPVWVVAMLGSLVFTVLGFLLVLTVYGRFFKIYIYSAIAPLPLSTFAAPEPFSTTGKAFVRSYIAVLLEGLVIVLACAIFSKIATTVSAAAADANAMAVVWTYVSGNCFNMLILVVTVKTGDRLIRDILGL